jgi:hypothetical protein
MGVWHAEFLDVVIDVRVLGKADIATKTAQGAWRDRRLPNSTVNPLERGERVRHQG